jgi:hypothetical protein
VAGNEVNRFMLAMLVPDEKRESAGSLPNISDHSEQ